MTVRVTITMKRVSVGILGAMVSIGGCTGGNATTMQVTPTFGGGFTDMSGPIEANPPFMLRAAIPFHPEPEPSVGLFADLDGDGVTEVLLSATAFDPDLGSSRNQIYRYDAASGALSDAGPLGNFLVAGAVDIDGDGLVDLLANRSDSNVVYNRGDGTFGDPVSLERTPADRVFDVHAWCLTDLDRDGWLDVLEGGARAGVGALQPLIRVGTRTWVNRADLIAMDPEFGPSGIFDVEFSAGRLLTVLGHEGIVDRTAPTFFRPSGTDPAGYPVFEPFDPTPAVTYYRPMPDETMSHSLLGYAPMGAAVGDIDGDGVIDLAISLDPVHQVFISQSAWPFADHTALTGFAEIPGDLGVSMLPWGVAMVDLDLDGRLDMVTAHGNDVGAFVDNSIGPQWATAHWNIGGGAFVDVSRRLGLDRRGQWRALSIGDLDGDGDADLAVGGMGEMPRIYRNDVVTENHGFALRLHGTTSNHLGVGTRVTVRPESSSREQVYLAGSVASPFAMPEPMVFVGIGKYTSARTVDIHWPAGTLQTLHDVPTGGVITVTEPPSISLDVPSRHVPADGVSAVMVTVSPRDPDGTLRTDAHIELALRYGDARIDGPAEVTASGMRFRVVAPTAPGSTVVTVTVDGAPMGISPRIFWDGP